MQEYHYQDLVIPYRYHFRKGMRRDKMSVNLKPTGLHIYVFYGAQPQPFWIDEVFEELGEWIAGVYRKLLRPETYYQTGRELLYMGNPYYLEIIPNPKRQRIKVIGIEGDKLLVEQGRAELKPNGMGLALRAWYIKQAKAYLEKRTLDLADVYGFHISGVLVKELKAQWGNYSSRGIVTLNARLMLTPYEIIDYVIIHELCHTKEMNHSPRFWAWVAVYCPAYPMYKHWLDKNGLLMAF